MEVLRSRQNDTVRYFRSLAADGALRRERREFLCVGEKLLREARSAGAEISMLLWTREVEGLPCRVVSPELLDYVSPLRNASGPVFTVKMRETEAAPVRRALVLENVQDPGNVGTVLRTADALGMDRVVLCGACADPWNPKTVRSTMGAIFRQDFVQTDLDGLAEAIGGLPLYGAALTEAAVDIRQLPGADCALAIGNEGKGLTPELLARCAGQVIIPMRPCAESLNAAVAASICMWELVRGWHD